MIEETTDWTELREFKAVLLTQSFLLSWDYDYGTLLADLDLCLSPEHAFYERPRPAQKACIRPALLEFPHCDLATANAPSRNAGSVEEAIRYFGSGSIHGFRRIGEGVYELSGNFDTVVVRSGRPLLRLKDETN